MRSENGKVTLVISDNGVGLINFRNTDSLGMQLVTGLTRQLGADIQLSRNGGTTFKVTFGKK